MEDIKIEPPNFSKEELMEKEYKKRWRELKIAKTRSSVLRKQITEAYEILENIRFDYLGDTAFREKIVGAKRELESSMTDYLLSDSYWEKAIKKHREMTPEEYDGGLNDKTVPTQSKVK